MIGDLYQKAEGRITDRTKFFNIINKNYPENEATRIGLRVNASQNYKEAFLEEKSKEVGVIELDSLRRPDSALDFGIGEH